MVMWVDNTSTIIHMKAKCDKQKSVNMARAFSNNVVVPVGQALSCSYLQYRDNAIIPTFGPFICSKASTPTPASLPPSEQRSSQLREQEDSGGQDMQSSSNLSLVTAGAISRHYYPAQGTVADHTLLNPPPSFYVTGVNNIIQVGAAPSQEAAAHHFFADFVGPGQEPAAKNAANLSGPAMMHMKLEGPDACWHDEHSSRSGISSDQAGEGAGADVCSTAAAVERFRPLRWWALADSNQDDHTLPASQAPAAGYVISDAVRLLAMASGADDTQIRANGKVDMNGTGGHANVETETSSYGYPQVASMMSSDLAYSRDFVGLSSIELERGVNECLAPRGWHQPLSTSCSTSTHDLPAFHENIQITESTSHDQLCNAEHNLRRNWQLQKHRSSIMNPGSYSTNLDHKNSYQAEAVQREAQTRRYENNEERLRINGSSGAESLAHIPVNMVTQSVHDQAAGRGLEWDNGSWPSMANAATKELLLFNSVQAGRSALGDTINNNTLTQKTNISQCSIATAYDAENTGHCMDMNTQQLLHWSSLHDNYNRLATFSRSSTQDRVAVPAGGGHQFATVASTNPNLPLALWDDKVINRNLLELPSITSSLVMQQTQVIAPPSSLIRNAINSPLINHRSGHTATAFSLSHLQSPLPNAVAGGRQLSRFIHSEDLSLQRGSSDFLSLDCTYARSGSMSVLRTSKYLKSSQQLLEESCNLKPDYSTRAPQLYCTVESKEVEIVGPKQHQQLSAEERCHLQMRKARLVGMVEELDRRYQQYQDQMQLIVTSFESATGMGAAVPYTALARKLISRQFRALRDAIGEHIQAACRTLGEDISSVPVLNKGETPRLRILDQRLRHHRTLQQVGMLQQHQAWRPQRGLPERSVAVLRAWLFEHFLHPYPKDSEKLMLARLTGLTRSQVANWFINARVRLWKPMVEQMYAEESKEVEPQDEAEASMVQYGEQNNPGYAWSDGHDGDNANMMQSKHVNGQKSQHYDSNNRLLHNGMTARHGVSLTLALQNSSSFDQLPSNSYNPNYHYQLQSAFV